MRQINFLIIFIFCLALVLFGLENPEVATIQIVQGIQVQAPLSVELILAMGIGAVLAWLFSMWTRLLQMLESQAEIRAKNAHIQELEQNVEQYKAQIQQQNQYLSLPPTVEPTT